MGDVSGGSRWPEIFVLHILGHSPGVLEPELEMG